MLYSEAVLEFMTQLLHSASLFALVGRWLQVYAALLEGTMWSLT